MKTLKGKVVIITRSSNTLLNLVSNNTISSKESVHRILGFFFLFVYLLKTSILEVLIYKTFVGILSLEQQEKDGGGRNKHQLEDEICSLATKNKRVALWPFGLAKLN